ncbi:peptidoglycan binding domain-containing protein [Streptomyces barkulensis]|uniref:peptidoglycan binding domain-containing protein n=1 Tax=Streptomyces barkulensis TaxID=1257026 RepID=UPI0014038AF5|nr:peptidoglycan binding domain-containing protein [Streptomyces barkulensis]
MSRETDSSSSGPQARGGAPHPPGSEPYPAPAGEPTAQPGEPKTETTLTTRIRINIPGSRPIPPVVVRKPVGEAGGESGEEAGGETSGADGSTAGPGGPSGAPGGAAPFTAGTPGPNGAPGKPGSPGPGGSSANGGGKPTSSWFAPRKSPPGGAQGDPAGANGGAPAPGAAAPAGTAPEPPRTGGPALDLGGPAGGPGFPADPAAAPGPSEAPGPGPAGDRAFGDTLVSGIPRVPAADDDGRPAPSADDHDSRPPAPAPAKRGRSKLVLLGVATFGVLGVAYGAGLLLDHADVPNGTTVLGVDIGGTDKDEAMNKLDAVLGERARMPLVLEVEGEQKTLKPSVAGLSLDTENTVRGASGRDYNPVSVIGSLLGGARQAEPVFKVDEEKLTAALKDLAGSSGGAPRNGMVKFADGKAVGVPGKPYKQVDADKGAGVLEDAYRTQVATGRSEAVELPVALTQPSVDQEEIDRAIREFGEPAMSGLATVRAGDRSIPFSPTGSLPKFLSMKPVNGKLVDTYDLKVLKELYGSTFDGILVTRGNGTKTPVTPQDVAGALREALRETDPAKRVGVIELDPQ